MDEQISLFPDYLAADIALCISKETKRTCTLSSDEYVSMIKTYYEGFGYISECFERITARHKSIKANMQGYITSVKDPEVVKVNISIINKMLTEMIAAAVRMAAIASRIESDVDSYDLYYSRRDAEKLEDEAKNKIEKALKIDCEEE